MMHWIPAPRSHRWLIVTPIAALIVGTMLWIIRFGLLGQTFTAVHALRFLLLAIVLCTAAGAAGWLGARYVALGIAAGIAAGLISMAVMSRNATGWEDLAGLAGFILAAALGFAAGIAAEAAAAFIRLLKRHSGGR